MPKRSHRFISYCGKPVELLSVRQTSQCWKPCPNKCRVTFSVGFSPSGCGTLAVSPTTTTPGSTVNLITNQSLTGATVQLVQGANSISPSLIPGTNQVIIPGAAILASNGFVAGLFTIVVMFANGCQLMTSLTITGF